MEEEKPSDETSFDPRLSQQFGRAHPEVRQLRRRELGFLHFLGAGLLLAPFLYMLPHADLPADEQTAEQAAAPTMQATAQSAAHLESAGRLDQPPMQRVAGAPSAASTSHTVPSDNQRTVLRRIMFLPEEQTDGRSVERVFYDVDPKREAVDVPNGEVIRGDTEDDDGESSRPTEAERDAYRLLRRQ